MTQEDPTPKKTARPHYERTDTPPHMRLTDRDREVIAAIHTYDGILADYQLRAMFFPTDTTGRYFQERMSFLFHNGYIDKPYRQHRAELKYTTYWLDMKGAEYLAGRDGLSLKQFKWRHPMERWSQVEHDVEQNDVRIVTQTALQTLPEYTLMEWVWEREFHRDSDRIEFQDKNGKKLHRLMYPDGYFMLGWKRPEKEQPDRLRFLLEFDRGTHSGISFVEEKVRSIVAYIRSPQYKARFGFNAGRCLVVVHAPDSAMRLQSLKERTESTGLADKRVFFFTTFEAAMTQNILTDPIWQQAGSNQPTPLLKLNENDQ